MHSNNEVGTLQPISRIAELGNAFDIPVHTDAVQSLGKVPISFKELGIFAMTISAHKVGGPIGVGALVLRKGVDITPILHGGGQERDIRSGTLNSAGIVAFAAAVQSAVRDLEANAEKVRSLRAKLIAAIQSEIPDATLNGVLNGQTLQESPTSHFRKLKVTHYFFSLMPKESHVPRVLLAALEFKKPAMY